MVEKTLYNYCKDIDSYSKYMYLIKKSAILAENSIDNKIKIIDLYHKFIVSKLNLYGCRVNTGTLALLNFLKNGENEMYNIDKLDDKIFGAYKQLEIEQFIDSENTNYCSLYHSNNKKIILLPQMLISIML